MKQTLAIFKDNFKILFLLSLMIVLPVYVIQEVIILPYFPDEMAVDDPKLIWYTLSVGLISLFIYVYRIASIRLAFNVLEGDGTYKSDIAGLMDFAVRFWPKIIVTALIYAISVAFGLMFFVFPGIIFFVSYVYYQYVSVKTGIWGRPSLMLSSMYMRKSLGYAAGIAFGTLVIRLIFTYIIDFVQSLIPNGFAETAAVVSIYVFLELFMCIVDIFVSQYIYNTKIDFDIALLQKKKSDRDA